MVTLILCGALVVPCGVAAKDTAGGAIVMAGLPTGAPAPMPVSWMVWGDPGASSVMTAEAVRGPSASGEKVTLIVQVAFVA